MLKYNQRDLKGRFDATDSTQQDKIMLGTLDAYKNLNDDKNHYEIKYTSWKLGHCNLTYQH